MKGIIDQLLEPNEFDESDSKKTTCLRVSKIGKGHSDRELEDYDHFLAI